ncbi:DUF2381 family protein [Corallococcus sp. CA047B]|uniref:DUF2381 family protein n=1 Tax=Corallococcus sp. CA047B TaxID=2316729 RepID=UPI0011C3E31C|nr:DUF2381 family protein [Corallococcus sp. CA047B]
MFASPGVVLPMLVVALGAAAPARAGAPDKRVHQERRLVVRADEAATLHLLRVAPGVVTTVVFNDDILPASVDTRALAPLFAQAKVYPGVMVLRPSVAMPDASRPLITARFAGEDAPRQVTFLLVTDPKEVDTLVEVSRHALSPEALGEELALLRAQCAATEAGLALLRARCDQTGLGGAVLIGALGQAPVSVERPVKALNGPGVKVVGSTVLYRHITTRVMAFTLGNAPEAAPWVPGVARLTLLDADGKPGRVVLEAPVRMLDARLTPGMRGQAVVEWHMPNGSEPGARYLMEAWNQEADRAVRWEGLSL